MAVNTFSEPQLTVFPKYFRHGETLPPHTRPFQTMYTVYQSNKKKCEITSEIMKEFGFVDLFGLIVFFVFYNNKNCQILTFYKELDI